MPAKRHEPARVWRFVIRTVGVLCLVLKTGSAAQAAGSLTILPVTIQLAPGQMATALTIINRGDVGTAFQIRAFDWIQNSTGEDHLRPTSTMLASPPLGTIAAGATQVVRMVLRVPPQDQEATYRILIDQIPPPAAPGTVRVALRLSIPIFAEPASRVAPHVQWEVREFASQAFLVATNDGTRHETVHDISLTAPDGRLFRVEGNVSPYILVGATRFWRIVSGLPAPGATLRLTASTDTGRLDRPVRLSGAR